MSRLSGNARGYLYLAATAAGGRKVGLRSAASERSLAAGLRRERLVLLRTWPMPSWLATSKASLKLADQAALNEQLAQLLGRGVPLVEALEVAASVVADSARPVIESLREQVSGGVSFSEACVRSGQFDTVAAAVYRAAERTGDLAGSAHRLADAQKRQLALRGKAATVLLYPAIVLSISIVVTIILLTMIVPRIGQALVQMTDSLPWYTQVVIAAGDALREHWFVLSMVAGGVLIAAVLGRAVLMGLVWRVSRKLPLIGKLMLTQDTARFFAVMAAMSRAGVPLADALGTAVGTVGDARLGTQLETLRKRLIEGGVLRTLIEDVSALPLATRKLLVAADRAGDLDQAFDGLAEDLAVEVDRVSTRVLSALEPALIVGLFLLIGGIILSIMVPMMSLSQQIG